MCDKETGQLMAQPSDSYVVMMLLMMMIMVISCYFNYFLSTSEAGLCSKLLFFENGTGSHNGTNTFKNTTHTHTNTHTHEYNFRVPDVFTGHEISSGRGNAVMKIEFHCWLIT